MGSHISTTLVYHVSWWAGHIFPAYATMRALRTGDQRAQRKWLSFWVIHAPFMSLEYLILSPHRFQSYAVLKLIALAWLLLPQFEGAQMLFETFVGPYLSRYESAIDARFQQARDGTKRSMLHLAACGMSHVRRQSIKLLTEANLSLKQRVLSDSSHPLSQAQQTESKLVAVASEAMLNAATGKLASIAHAVSREWGATGTPEPSKEIAKVEAEGRQHSSQPHSEDKPECENDEEQENSQPHANNRSLPDDLASDIKRDSSVLPGLSHSVGSDKVCAANHSEAALLPANTHVTVRRRHSRLSMTGWR